MMYEELKKDLDRAGNMFHQYLVALLDIKGEILVAKETQIKDDLIEYNGFKYQVFLKLNEEIKNVLENDFYVKHSFENKIVKILMKLKEAIIEFEEYVTITTVNIPRELKIAEKLTKERCDDYKRFVISFAKQKAKMLQEYKINNTKKWFGNYKRAERKLEKYLNKLDKAYDLELEELRSETKFVDDLLKELKIPLKLEKNYEKPKEIKNNEDIKQIYKNLKNILEMKKVIDYYAQKEQIYNQEIIELYEE
ncbi:MAG: hypothetical protein ACMXX6_01700 [Candidatus Woesearchaeota archaeon]